MKKSTIKLIAMFLTVVLMLPNFAGAGALNENNASNDFFASDVAFFDKAASSDEEASVADEYPFIYGFEDGFAIGNISENDKADLVQGYVYLKNWKTATVRPLIEKSTTALFVSESGNVYAADENHIISLYDLAGKKQGTVIKSTCKSSPISNIAANDDVIFFTQGNAVYRYFIPTSSLEKMCEMNTDEPIAFTALTNNSVQWHTLTDEHFQSADDYIVETTTVNFRTGEVTKSRGDDCDDSAYDDGRVDLAPQANKKYFNDFGDSVCTCHGQKHNGVVYSCSTDGSCDCKPGSWDDYSGIQCYGYALDWYSKNVSTTAVGSTKISGFTFSSNTSIAQAQLADLLKQSCYGAHLRVYRINKNGDIIEHSLIITDPDYTSSSFVTTDANRSDYDYCVIQNTTFAYSTLISKYPYVKWVWTQNHSYTSIPSGQICNKCGQMK